MLLCLLVATCSHNALAQSATATCTSSTIDMVLCLDGSYSMGNSYQDVQTFAKQLMTKFTISDTKTRVAVLRFETEVDDATGGFSGDLQRITAEIDVPLPGGITNTDKCITAGRNLLTGSTHRSGSAQLLLVITDGSPSDQSATETAAQAAMADGVVIVGVGVNVGSYGVPNVLKMTSNQCPDYTGCSLGLKDPPSCVVPCDDHYIDASTFDALADNSILDSVVEAVCVEPGCQYVMGPWSECDSASATNAVSRPCDFIQSWLS